MARTPVLPEATYLRALTAHLRRPLLDRQISRAITFDNSLRTHQFDRSTHSRSVPIRTACARNGPSSRRRKVAR